MRAVEAPSPLGTDLCGLLWLRSMTASRQAYVRSAQGGRTVSYGQLRAVSGRWSALLDDLGVGPGETVGIAVSDPLDFALAFLGVLASGRTAAPLDPASTDAELSRVATIVEPRIVVADRPAPPGPSLWPDDREWVAMPVGTFGLGSGAGVGPGTPAAGPGPDAATGVGAGAGASRRGARVYPGAVVLATSGTTGAPKVVVLDEDRLLHTARAVAAALELSATDCGFNPLPLFHINAEVVGLLATLVAGSTLVLDDRFHRTGFWAQMERHGVTWINAVPAILAHLGTLAEDESVPLGIRFARSASAPLPLPVLERFERATGIPIVETYGMTEAASQITATPLHGPRKPGSVGVPAGAEVRIVHGDGGEGRVLVRGPGVIAAYGRPGLEDRVDAEGWLETGDLGHLDDDGYLFLVGRVDDVINRGGEKVHPKEVEDVVLAEPGISAAAVVGWDHQSLGQVPVAYLVLDPSSGPWDRRRASALVDRVHNRCAAALSRAKRPVAFHVVEDLPRGATGKVVRRSVTGCPTLLTLLVR